MHPLTVQIQALTLPPATRALLVKLFEEFGPIALKTGIELLERHIDPAYVPLLEMLKADVIALIPAPTGA